LEPGEAMPWHTDVCSRFTVVVGGEALGIEYRDSGEVESFPVHPGLAEWDEPQARVHRGVNVGAVPYEEVVIFFLDKANTDPNRSYRPNPPSGPINTPPRLLNIFLTSSFGLP